MVRSTAVVGLYPRPQRGRLSACAECAPRLPQRRRERGCGGTGMRSPRARGRCGPRPRSAPGPRQSPSPPAQHRPGPRGAPSLTAQHFPPRWGPNLILYGTAADARPPGAARLVPSPRERVLFFITKPVLVSFGFAFLSAPQKVSKYSALVASVAPQYPCSKGSSKHASR